MQAGPRQHLEQRFSEISTALDSAVENALTDLDSLVQSALADARRDQAEQLNQAVRRLRISPDADELCATLAGAAARLASGAIVFRVLIGIVTSETISLPLSDAPALAAAIQSEDPLIVAATASELSDQLFELLAPEPDARVAIFPVSSADGVSALVFCYGTVQVPAVELLTQVASAVWTAFPKPEPEPEPEPEREPELITIAPVPAATEPEPANAKAPLVWEDLMSSEQQIHLRAQRFARVKAAEMRLHHAELVQSGRNRRNLYESLRQPIDEARQDFRKQFFTGCPSMVDYLHLELTRTLANDDSDLLGSTYPGPLV